MREILFRGKRKDIDKWIEGWYVPPVDYNENHWDASISYKVESGHLEDVEVIPETIGQYTGLTDKNGTKIFEGDILKATVIHNDIYRDSTRKVTKVYEVKYHETYCYFYLARRKDNRLFDGNWSYGVTRLEVIGNIHDNPELLVIEE